MKKFAVTMACVAAIVSASSSAHARTLISGGGASQIRQNAAVAPRHLSPAEKSASDQAMSGGLSQLQAAASALNSGNGSASSSYLAAAISDMKQALPIYHGYRVKSMRSAEIARHIIGLNRKNSPQRAMSAIERAISDAQTALQNSGSEVNER